VLSGNIQVQNKPDSLQGNGRLIFSNLIYQGTELDTVSMEFSLVDKRLEANLRAIMDGNEQLTGTLDVPFVPDNPENLDDSFFDEPVRGNLVINPIDLTKFKELLSSFSITETEGILSFNGQLSGSAREPDFEGSFRLANPILSGIRIDSAFARVNYHHIDKKLTARSEVTAQGQKAASIFAELPLSMDFRTFEMNTPGPTDSLTFNMVTNNFNISVFNDFLNKDYMSRLRGLLNANIEISGTTEDLEPKGYLRLSEAEVTVPIAGIRLTRISSDFSFTENGIRLNRLRANSGSGSFSADGTITLEGITPTEMNINANASRFRLANTDDYNLTVGLRSTLTGTPNRPKASGSLTVNNGFIYLQNFGERSVEIVKLEEEGVSSFSPYDSLAIDMSFVIEYNFQVRNSRYLDLQVALSGDLDAQKETNGELQLFGTLTADEGYARPLGKQFNLEEGRFTFSGPIDEPELYISTSYIPQSSQKEGNPVILYYIIEGRGMDPEFRFESDPQMEQQDIICYTIFNKPCYALESWQQVVSGGSGTSPTDLLVGVLLDEVETLATQELGIDVVQIDNSRSGSGGGTSITTGWYLNRRTFFAIVNKISGSTPQTLFILEYMLKNNLDLILTQGDDSRQGIDLRWQFDY
jgi:autotransporter translocation and assembly factor TamB